MKTGLPAQEDILSSHIITDYKIIGDCEKIITGIEQDSRKVVSGTLFVCMNGAKVDGHDFAISN